MAREEKTLSEKEKKRLKKTNKIVENYENKGYKKVDLTTDVLKANVYAILVSFPFILLFIVLYYVINRNFNFTFSYSFWGILMCYLIFIASIVVHELIHGITFSIFAKNHWKDIDFGIVWSALTPYCTCISPVKKHEYLLSLLMPCIILGIIPSIVSIFIASPFLLFFGLIMILSAGGDLLICLLILKHKSKKKECVYLDHPTEVGVLLFEK